MKLAIIKNFILNLGQRVIIAFVILFLCLSSFLDFKKIIIKARMATLNRLMPQSYDYLKEIENNPQRTSAPKLAPFTFYFRKANEYLPNNSDVLGMLGFCYYYEGNIHAAEKAFTKAVELNPYFLGYSYNLALIKHQKGEIEESIQLLLKAAQTDFTKNLSYVYNSRVYRPIIFSSQMTQEDVHHLLKSAFRRVYELLALNYYQNKNYDAMLKIAVEALALDLDEHGSFLYFVGIAAFESKEYSKAGQLFQESIKKNANHAESFEFLGKTLKALGEETKAEVFLKTAEGLKNKRKVFNFNSKENSARIF